MKGLPEICEGRKGYVGVIIKLVFSEIEDNKYKEVKPMILEF